MNEYDRYEVRDYITPQGADIVAEWLIRLSDKSARVAIDRRLNRIENGNFGDHRFCRDGVWELRIDLGPGYRVYYAIAGEQIVLLLFGGDKRTQTADIARACDFWREWQRRPER